MDVITMPARCQNTKRLQAIYETLIHEESDVMRTLAA